jgi:purine-nucleoside phosphorylase
MTEYYSLEDIDHVAQGIRAQIKTQPRIAIILGSGLGGLADEVQDAERVSYNQLHYQFPAWPVPTVPGHVGYLVFGTLAGQPVMVMQGRVHYYEGYSMQQVTLPVRVMQRLGVEMITLTNAAGAVNPGFEPGDLMLITDHLNMIGMAGLSPLRGPNLDDLGPRFPDMSQAYDRKLNELARQSAKRQNVVMHEGIYACLAGPSFETPADLRFLRGAGVDAVGMSTVPEATVARHGGTRVLGISGISNKANLDGNTLTTHEEVLQAGKVIAPRLSAVLRGVISGL